MKDKASHFSAPALPAAWAAEAGRSYRKTYRQERLADRAYRWCHRHKASPELSVTGLRHRVITYMCTIQFGLLLKSSYYRSSEG